MEKKENKGYQKKKQKEKGVIFLDAKALRMREIVKDVRRQLKVCRFGKKEETAKSFSFEIKLYSSIILNLIFYGEKFYHFNLTP